MADRYKCKECGHNFFIAPEGSLSCENCGSSDITKVRTQKIPWKYIIIGGAILLLVIILWPGGGGPSPRRGMRVEITNVIYDTINQKIEIKVKGKRQDLYYKLGRTGDLQKSRIFKDVKPGNYLPIVEYENGDSVIAWKEIIHVISPPPPDPPQISHVASTDETGTDKDDGTIQIAASTGSPPIKYSIDNGTSYQDDKSFDNLPPGEYLIKIKDKIGEEFTWIDTIHIKSYEAVQVKIPPAPEELVVENALNELFSSKRGDPELNNKVRNWFTNDQLIVDGKLWNTNQQYTIYQYLMRQYIGQPGSLAINVTNVRYDDNNRINYIKIEEEKIN